MQRTVRATLDLEIDLARVALDGELAARASLVSVAAEQKGLINELDGVIAWLSAGTPEPGSAGFPPPQARAGVCRESNRRMDPRHAVLGSYSADGERRDDRSPTSAPSQTIPLAAPAS